MVMVRKERESVPACKAAGGNWAVPASSTESSCTGSCQPRGASNALKVQANYFPGWETIPMHLVVSKWEILIVFLHRVLSTQRRRPPPMHSKPIISLEGMWRTASLLPFQPLITKSFCTWCNVLQVHSPPSQLLPIRGNLGNMGGNWRALLPACDQRGLLLQVRSSQI